MTIKGTHVYNSNDICKMYGINADRIAYHIQKGLIPPPIQGVGGGKSQRKWSKAAINKHLGIEETKADTSLIREIIAQQIKLAMA